MHFHERITVLEVAVSAWIEVSWSYTDEIARNLVLMIT